MDAPHICPRCGYEFEELEDGPCPRCKHFADIHQDPHAHGMPPADAPPHEAPPHADWGTEASTPHFVTPPPPANPHFDNPTPIHVGMTAHIDGRDYTVVTRVVQGMDEEGSTYYWNEFQLVSADKSCVYLEYDEGTWRIMWELDNAPLHNAGNVGETVHFGDVTARVTERSVETTYYQEGGSEPFFPVLHASAEYLDAHAGDAFYSGEWDHEHAEYYQGRTVSHQELCAWFTLPTTAFPTGPYLVNATTGKTTSVWPFIFIVLGVIFFIWLASMYNGNTSGGSSIRSGSTGSHFSGGSGSGGGGGK